MSPMRFTGLALCLGCLLLAGCSGGNKPSADTVAGAPKKAPPKVDKVQKTDVVVGKGKVTAAEGDTVWVLFRGTFASNGKEFDSNMGPDKEVYSLTLGQGGVIKGWEEGIPGMKIGGERKLHIPSSLAYGANGREGIPPNADLDFDIKLLGVMKAGEDQIIDTVDQKVGNGQAAKAGDKVTIQYVVKLLNGKVVDDSHGKPAYSFIVGSGQTLSCIDTGVKGMKVGGIREITGPPSTAYVGRSIPSIPANSEVKVTVELQSIGK